MMGGERQSPGALLVPRVPVQFPQAFSYSSGFSLGGVGVGVGGQTGKGEIQRQ